MWERILTILRKEFRSVLRDPRMRFVIIGLPVVQTLIFGYAVTLDVRHVRLVVVDRDGERFGLPRVNASCDYLSPARYRDVLSITVSVEEAGRSSIRYGFRFSLGDRPVAKGVITVCFCAMTPQGISARPIPDWFRQRLGVGA